MDARTGAAAARTRATGGRQDGRMLAAGGVGERRMRKPTPTSPTTSSAGRMPEVIIGRHVLMPPRGRGTPRPHLGEVPQSVKIRWSEGRPWPLGGATATVPAAGPCVRRCKRREVSSTLSCVRVVVSCGRASSSRVVSLGESVVCRATCRCGVVAVAGDGVRWGVDGACVDVVITSPLMEGVAVVGEDARCDCDNVAVRMWGALCRALKASR